jgi:hypothetical protein
MDLNEPINNADIAHPARLIPEALVVGQEFNTFQDLKVAMDKWAVAGRFAIRFEKSDRKRNVIRCKDSRECVFNVRAMWKASLEKVSIQEDRHGRIEYEFELLGRSYRREPRAYRLHRSTEEEENLR